jgi:hypothetical protein
MSKTIEIDGIEYVPKGSETAESFEDYLQDIHADQYQGLDDEMPEEFINWLEYSDVNDIIEHAQKYADSLEKISASEALFGFCGWLTTSNEKTVMSATDDAAIVADLIKEFMDANDIPNTRKCFPDNVVHPKLDLFEMMGLESPNLDSLTIRK